MSFDYLNFAKNNQQKIFVVNYENAISNKKEVIKKLYDIFLPQGKLMKNYNEKIEKILKKIENKDSQSKKEVFFSNDKITNSGKILSYHDCISKKENEYILSNFKDYTWEIK